MDTIVKPPTQNQKNSWLHQQGIKKESIGYDWLLAGFAQALFALETNLSFKYLRDYYLVNDFSSIEEMAWAAEKLSISKRKINQSTLETTINYTNFLVENTVIYPNTEEVLSLMKEEGYLIYLVSNLMSPYKSIINNLDLKKWFKRFFISCEIGYQKPNNKIFQEALKSTDSSPNESIFIGDNWDSDILGAIKLNIDAIFINRNKQGIPNHLMNYGLKGLLETNSDGQIQVKKELIPIIKPFLPNQKFDFEGDIMKEVYKDSKGLIQPKSLNRVIYVNDVNELNNILIN